MPPAVAAQLLSAISMTGAQMSPQKAQQLKSQQQQHQNSHHHQSHPQSSRHHDGLAQDSQAQNGNHARRDTELPFGYNYDLGHDEDILNEPPPAPDGDMSLLTDEDAKLLSSFFETIETDTFSSSWGEGLAIPSDWQQFDDPAAALDSQSILGNFQQPQPQQQQQQRYGISFSAADSSLSNNMPYSDTPSKQNHHQNSASQSQSHMFYPATTTHNGLEVPREIYEAAATLVQDTRSMQQPHSRRSYHYSRTSNTSQDSAYPPSPSQPPQHHLHSQSLSGFLSNQAPAAATADMAQRASISRRNLSMSFEWGTDSSFNNASGYVPASDRDASTMLEKQQQAATIDRWFTVSQSGATTAAPTRAQTPQPASQQQQQQQPASFGIERQSPKRAIATTATGEDTESDSEAIQPPATKRRKSMHTRDGTSPNALTSSATTSEKTTKTRAKNGSSSGPVRSSKSSSTPTDSAPVPGSGPGAPLSSTTKPRKQRTSTSTPATNNNTTGGPQSSKPPRKNLTDQQKRENHIFSEQRRRTAIKVGFEELTEMVPGIKGGGFSKSAVLNISCSWLQDLLDGNKRLEEQLRLTSSGSGIDLAKAEAES
ncbi:hypothetical protein HOO65_020747 [Ceratocystis lukuohia]|uniref:BHLH domain-containing protein n=1 Tax=Ceratocystis lukuohia TaxID=2019550 RepID=A0ABR4MPN6_9PEZI